MAAIALGKQCIKFFPTLTTTIMKYIVLIFAFVFLVSCKENTRGGQNRTRPHEDTIYVDIKGNKYKFLGEIPQNLRTKEQAELIDKLNETSIRYTSVKNNHIILDLTREEFLATGIPGRYYESLVKNIQDNNQYIDANGIKDVDKMMEDRRKWYQRLRTGTK